MSGSSVYEVLAQMDRKVAEMHRVVMLLAGQPLPGLTIRAHGYEVGRV